MNKNEEQAFKCLINLAQLAVANGNFDLDDQVNKFRSNCFQFDIHGESVDLLVNCFYDIHNEFIKPLMLSNSLAAKEDSLKAKAVNTIQDTGLMYQVKITEERNQLREELAKAKSRLETLEAIVGNNTKA